VVFHGCADHAAGITNPDVDRESPAMPRSFGRVVFGNPKRRPVGGALRIAGHDPGFVS
jgi:hypothetical protein